MKRFLYFCLVAVIVLLLVTAVSCAGGQPVVEQPSSEQPATEEPVAKETVVEVPTEEPADIQFFTWAEDDFEQNSLEQLVDSFYVTERIPVNLDVVR